MNTGQKLDTGPPKVQPGRRNPGAQNCQLATDGFSLPPAECDRKQFVALETLSQQSLEHCLPAFDPSDDVQIRVGRHGRDPNDLLGMVRHGVRVQASRRETGETQRGEGSPLSRQVQGGS